MKMQMLETGKKIKGLVGATLGYQSRVFNRTFFIIKNRKI
jgi:hypothetical protein